MDTRSHISPAIAAVALAVLAIAACAAPPSAPPTPAPIAKGAPNAPAHTAAPSATPAPTYTARAVRDFADAYRRAVRDASSNLYRRANANAYRRIVRDFADAGALSHANSNPSRPPQSTRPRQPLSPKHTV